MTKYRSNGFTLIEVLIASSILVMVTGAVVGLSRVAFHSQDLSLERTQAYHLVQEGLEMVHQMRDTQTVSQTTDFWVNLFGACDRTLATCSPAWDSQLGRWRLVDGSSTELGIHNGTELIDIDGLQYRRAIRILPAPELPRLSGSSASLSANDSQTIVSEGMRRIQVEVEWDDRGIVRKLVGETYLSQWHLGV